jgi:hypothetical protein
MASKIKVDELAGSSASTVTVPTGQTLTVTDGIAPSSLQTVTAAKGGTGQASYTAGDTLYASGSTAISKLAKGTAGQIMQMNTGATAPEWATASTGNFVKISSGSISSSSSTVDFDNVFDSTDSYNRYMFYIDNFYGSTDAQMRFRWRILTTDNSTTAVEASDVYTGVWVAARNVYDGSGMYAQNGTRKAFGELHEEYAGNHSSTYLEFGGNYSGNSVNTMRGEQDEANWWKFEFFQPDNNNYHQKGFQYEVCGRWSGSVGATDNNVPAQIAYEAGYGQSYDAGLTSIRKIKGFRLYPTSGTMTAGDWVLYGIKR